MIETKPNIASVMRDALGDRVDPAAESFVEMMAEDFVMEFPFARPGMQTRIEGRTAVLTYLMTVGQGISIDSVSNVVVHDTTDPDVVIVEFDGHGRSLKTDEPYEQRYISVIRTRDGRIVHYKDYWNPIQGLKAQIGSAAVDAFILDGAA
ncbi:MAG TPA: nuclear transport factor 2 family protein [Phenylobacterium sp.]|jgi:ketosteroid isomerase-like protein|nr:nuclear transport factor 2 family protein [Phenylobacterium sp.]